MGDLYSECIVKRKTPVYTIAVKLLLIIATFISLTFMVLMLSVIPFIIAVAFGIGGRTFAANTLEKLEKKMENNDTK